MGTASPVIVHVTNTIDWWAVVLDGVLGAVVGGVISLGVAMLVVRRTHDSDRRLARERRALDSAERMMDTLAGASGGLATIVGDYSDDANERRRFIGMEVSRTVVTEKPAMTDYRYDHLFDDATTAIADYVAFIHDDLQERPGAVALYHSGGVRGLGGGSLTQMASAKIRPIDRAAFDAVNEYLRSVVGEFAAFRRAADHSPASLSLPSYAALGIQADAIVPRREAAKSADTSGDDPKGGP